MASAEPASGRPDDDGVPHAAAADPGADPPEEDSLTQDALAAWEAARNLSGALRRFIAALLGLARSEWQLAKASWPFVVGIFIVLVGLSLSLWASLITLGGWALYVLTGSVGWALLALVGVHAVLLVAARLLLKRASRNLTLPGTREELHRMFNRERRQEESD